MRIYLALDVSPEDGERPALSERIIDELEAEIENISLEVDRRVYTIRTLGSGKTPRDLTESIAIRRHR